MLLWRLRLLLPLLVYARHTDVTQQRCRLLSRPDLPATIHALQVGEQGSQRVCVSSSGADSILFVRARQTLALLNDFRRASPFVCLLQRPFHAKDPFPPRDMNLSPCLHEMYTAYPEKSTKGFRYGSPHEMYTAYPEKCTKGFRYCCGLPGLPLHPGESHPIGLEITSSNCHSACYPLSCTLTFHQDAKSRVYAKEEVLLSLLKNAACAFSLSLYVLSSKV